MRFSSPLKKSKNPWRIVAIGVAIFVCVVVLAVVGASLWQQRNLRPVSNVSSQILVTIPAGSSTPKIGELLETSGAIRSALAFVTYVRSREYDDDLRAGTYAVDPSLSTQEIVKILIEGSEASRLFTIPPGLRLDQVRQRFIDAGFNADEVDAALNPNQYRNHPALVAKPRDASLEGYLYPESFTYTEATAVSEIIEQSLDEMAKRLTPERIQAFSEQGLSPHEAVILASIVEREVPQPEDRRIVAQIFLRRLREGISLGADATYVYAAAITGEEAFPELDSPYNTRKYTGLPPGPISNMDDTALIAVANPADTNYLFFVSGDDGRNYWAFTQEEHDENIVNHCQINCR